MNALLADMRRFASPGGIGFYVIHSSRGTVPIAIDEINSCGTDEKLLALIRERCEGMHDSR